MRARVEDAAVLRELSPLAVAAYLRATGWEEDRAGEQSSTWTRSARGETLELLLPATRDCRDYAQRLADALAVLEAAEERSQLAIVRALATAGADAIELRPGGPGEGGLALEDGVRLHQGAHDLLLHAACSVIERRAVHPRRCPEAVREYLRTVRFGPAEPDGYRLTVLSPLPPTLTAPAGPLYRAPPEPFGRATVKLLLVALEAARRAADEAAATGRLDAFQVAVAAGLSANLCRALVAVGQACGGSVELEVRWSLARTEDVPTGPTRVRFLPDALGVLEQAARMFREVPAETCELAGRVVRLERASPSRPGRVTIAAAVQGEHRRVVAELDGPAYLQAIRAHERGRSIALRGLLEREGRAWWLRQPTLVVDAAEQAG